MFVYIFDSVLVLSVLEWDFVYLYSRIFDGEILEGFIVCFCFGKCGLYLLCWFFLLIIMLIERIVIWKVIYGIFYVLIEFKIFNFLGV